MGFVFDILRTYDVTLCMAYIVRKSVNADFDIGLLQEIDVK